jgi:hypothetical protein
MTRTEIKNIKADFDKMIIEFATKNKINVSTGNITFNDVEMRFKITMSSKSVKTTVSTPSSDFKVGDYVTVNHTKINKSDIFEVIKVNRKKIKIKDGSGQVFIVSPSILVKKTVLFSGEIGRQLLRFGYPNSHSYIDHIKK